ncbi:thiol:disulfide interchange protein DsbA/DsbL [Chitinolyticbacter meiyuanensis]|uniref:thiol:disulfide interchange protein DsbA/DsbL n=1 Tax=Chitinolyticbacter meiyuanensis TaxID=682798 RepID=UPI001651F76C|nr:thiol:disulfide interchange protein DsbA/DsbL [Chitinolyticbacter meiyuanensis]
MFARMLKWGVLAAGLLAASLTFAATEGKEYKRLAKPQPVAKPGKLEVVEFFWYGCPHCFAVEPYVETWAKKLPADVNFRRVHVMWPGRSDLEGHAKIFVALEQMGIGEKYAMPVFRAVQTDRIELRRADTLFDWVKKQGIDQAKFKAAYNGFSMGVSLAKLSQAAQDYKIEGVPTFIVNGKYVTSPSMVGTEDSRVFQVIDELLAKERGSKPAAKPAAPAKK